MTEPENAEQGNKPGMEQPAMPPSGMPASGGMMTGSKKMPMMWIVIGLVGLVVIGGLAWWYMASNQPKPVVQVTYKVGLMTVDEALAGTSSAMKRGTELAAKTLKTDAVNIQIINKETSCDAKSAAKVMDEFVTLGVVAVVGELCSDATLAAAPIANSKHIPLISPGATSPRVTNAGDYVYRTIPSDALSGEFIATAMYNKYSIRKLAILHSDNSYGNDARTAVKTVFEKLGGKVVTDQSYAADVTDPTDKVKAVKTSGADGMYIVGVTLNDAILLKRQELGITTPVFGPEYFNDDTIITGTHGATEGLVYNTPSTGTRTFTEKYFAAYKEQPIAYTAQTYDAVGVIAQGLNDGATDGTSLKAALDKMSYNGVTGTIKFDSNGDVSGNYQLFVIKSGKSELVE
jgi:branched-chain amino acid transport system substrate-binding protein